MTQVELGTSAPDFTLPASDGTALTLSDLVGKKVVIYFYPKDMTPGCTTQSCDFRDYHPQFKDYNTVVLGISPDDLNSHDKFINKHSLPFLLLADTEHQVAESYDVWKPKKMFGKEFMGIERSTFLIDEKGIVRKIWRKVKVNGHVEEVLEAVKEMA